MSKSSRNTHTLLCVPTEPPLLKSAAVIDRTAAFVARSANPPQFEEKIRENQRQDPKFAFLNSADPYHAYYRHRMDKVVRGEIEEGTAPKEGEKVEEKSEEELAKIAERRREQGRRLQEMAAKARAEKVSVTLYLMGMRGC